jgi:hypothetical protein
MCYLKCSKCGCFNEVKTEYQMFCSCCNKKLVDNYSDWKIRNPDNSFDDFKQLICTTEKGDIPKSNSADKKSPPKILIYLASVTIALVIFYIIGQIGKEALSRFFKNPTLDKAMMEMASEINKSCPFMVDEETRLDNTIALPNNIFQYNYTLINVEKKSIDIDNVKKYLEPVIIKSLKTSPQMKEMRENKTTVNYFYRDKAGVFLFIISITPNKYQ